MEKIEILNQRLIDHFGLDTNTNQPIFRIVWSNDQTEMRETDRLDSGIQLLHPIVREVKKYSYVKDKYILERLSIVPEFDRKELAEVKLSYEPLWVFETGNHEFLYPIWPAIKFIVDTLYASLGKKSMRKYIDTEENTTPEGREQKIDKLTEELFGNETETADALRYHEGVVVPSNYKVN